jgi:uncharacterized linocin/CFP29 family protein
MGNGFLMRDDAPIGPDAWKMIDSTMAEAAKSILAGRRLLHIEGPFGLGLKAVPMLDRVTKGGITTSAFVPVHMIQTMFTLGKRDLAAFERDHLPLDTGAVATAAIEAARLEDAMIFNGAQGVKGLLNVDGSTAMNLSSWDTPGAAADDIVQAVTRLDDAGFHGPYSLGLAPGRYNLLFRRYTQGNVTELEHIRQIATEGVIKAPVLENGGVLLASGRQYASVVIGQDMTVGFIGPVDETLEFSITESLAPLIRQPKAICVLEG